MSLLLVRHGLGDGAHDLRLDREHPYEGVAHRLGIVGVRRDAEVAGQALPQVGIRFGDLDAAAAETTLVQAADQAARHVAAANEGDDGSAFGYGHGSAAGGGREAPRIAR